MGLARRRVTRARRVSRGRRSARAALPRFLLRLFWDVDAARLRLDRDTSFLARRVLAAGGLRELRWLRRRLRDEELRDLLLRSEGRGLSAQRIRFYELIFDIPKTRADVWVEAARRQPWAGRHRR